MIMDSFKNGRWAIPFKTFNRLRVEKILLTEFNLGNIALLIQLKTKVDYNAFTYVYIIILNVKFSIV